MSWLVSPITNTPFDALLGLRPELLAGYRKFYAALWEKPRAPVRLLEIARLRIAWAHGCAAEAAITHRGSGVTDAERDALARGATSSFDGLEATVLAVAEKMSHQHHAIDDDEIATIRNALGDGATVALITGMALFDANCRLKLVFDVDVRPATVDAPATATGPIY